MLVCLGVGDGCDGCSVNLHCGNMVIAGDDFKWIVDYDDFCLLPEGTLVASDQTVEIICPFSQGGYLFMRNLSPNAGDIAFVWATTLPLESDEEDGAIVNQSNEKLTSLSNKIQFGNPNASVRYLIIGAIHGSEPCGVTAINGLIEEKFFENLTNMNNVLVTLVLGNPRAYDLGKRFCEENLNRLIASHLMDGSSYERRRAKFLADEISRSTITIDLHSSSAPTPVLGIPSPNFKSEALALKLPAEIVIRNISRKTVGNATTMDWVYHMGKVGVTFECGQHDDPNSVVVARNIILSLLLTDIDTREKIEMECYETVRVRPGFHFIKEFEAMSKVGFGELIARDDQGDITCPYENGGYIIMPTKQPFLGEEAWFWGIDPKPSIRMLREPGLRDLYTSMECEQPSYLTPYCPILTFGDRDAPVKILFSCCIYGNEICGLLALNQAIESGYFDNITFAHITCVLAYPEAYEKNEKIDDENMNRLFVPGFDKSKFSNAGRRARLLADYIDECDIYIGFGSTENETVPILMPISNIASIELAKRLPIRTVIYDIAHRAGEIYTSMNWAYLNHKTAISICAGQHESRQSVETCKHIIKSMILRSDEPPTVTEEYKCIGRVDTTTDNFKYTRPIHPFEEIPFGEPIAQDSTTLITSPTKNSIILLPTQSAFWWGTKLK